MTDRQAHPRFPLVAGIVGGLGPHAHIWLEQRLLQRTAERFGVTGDGDYPEWIVSSMPQTPDRTAAIAGPGGGQGPSPLPWLVRSLRRLRNGGADFAAIACNTAHVFFPAMAAAANPLPLPIVHVIVEAAEFVATRYPAVRRIGLLATSGTCQSGIFARALRRRDVIVLQPDAATQERVMTAIYGPLTNTGRRCGGIKAGRLDQPDPGQADPPRQMLQQAANWLIERQQAEAILVACSEISLAIQPGDLPVPTIDTMDVLADAILDLVSGQRTLASLGGPRDWP